MPVVGYRRSQRTTPLPDARKTRVPIGQVETPLIRATPSAESFGAGLGETMQRVGSALYGQQLDARAQEIQDAKQRQNRIAIFEADTKLSAWENQYLHDPQNGVLNKRGKDAFGLPDTVSQDFDKVYGDLWQSLSNDEQRDAFDQLAHTRRKDIHATVMRHVSQQMKAFETENYSSYLDNSQSAALSNYDDPLRVDTEIERQRTAVWNYGKDNGLGDEWIQAQTAKQVSATRAGVVTRFLAAGQDQLAENYLANWKHDMLPQDIVRLEAPMKEGVLRGQSQREADRIMRTMSTEAEAIGEAQQIQDPKLRDEVQSRIEHAWQLRDQQQRQAREEQSRQAAEAIAQAKAQREQLMTQLANAIDVQKSTDAVPPAVWSQLTIQERNALDSYAKRLDETGGKIKTDQQHWYGLMQYAQDNPKEFAAHNLLLDRARLSDSDFQEMVKLQKNVRDGNQKEVDKVIDGIRTPRDIIQKALHDIGLKRKDNGYEDAELQLLEKTDERVDALQRNSGKKATDADVQKIVDGLVIDVEAFKGGSILSFLPGGAPLFDSKIQKRAFQMTVGDIPPSERPKLQQALRSMGLPVSDQAEVDLYVRTQQRLKK